MRCGGLLTVVGVWSTGVASPLPSGTFFQVVSNRFVQSTSEIDWACVTVHIVGDDWGQTWVTKSAFLQDDGMSGVILHTVPSLAEAGDNQTVSLTHRDVLGFVTTVYDARSISDRLIVVTGREDPSLFVWVRDVSEFYTSGEAEETLALTDAWGYTSLEKEPRLSFTTNCQPVVA
jgi:hypothetical protein